MFRETNSVNYKLMIEKLKYPYVLTMTSIKATQYLFSHNVYDINLRLQKSNPYLLMPTITYDESYYDEIHIASFHHIRAKDIIDIKFDL